MTGDPKQRAASLLEYLHSVEEDRGVMADLRSALSPARRSRSWPHLDRAGIGDPRVETVAGLFALHPEDTSTGNLGTTCHEISKEHNSFEGRFRRLLSCDKDEICERLRPVILAAKSKGLAVNYEALFVDIWYWNDRTKADWAREYWGAPVEEDSPTVAEVTE